MINITPNSVTTLCILLTDYKQTSSINYTLNIVSNFTKEEYNINVVDESSRSTFSIFNIEINNINSGSTGSTVYIPYSGEYLFRVYENPDFIEDLSSLNMIYSDKLKISGTDVNYTSYNLEKTYIAYDPR